MKIGNVAYDTHVWRFRVGERIRHGDVAYDILARESRQDARGAVIHTYTLRTLSGVVRIMRNYVINLEARRG